MNKGTQMNAIAVIDAEATTLPPSGSLSLALPKGLPFDQWTEIGRELAAREKVLNWWIGDWYRFGVKAYGEALADHTAQELWGLQAESVRKYGWVAEKFPPVRRLTTISFTHHHEVAALPPSEADALLERAVPTAEGKGLSTRELRIATLKRKVHLGIVRPRDVDDDWNYKALKAIAAAWNRAERSVREEFAGLVAESDFGVIEV